MATGAIRLLVAGAAIVSVSGKEMYKIPVLLGLMQITNLALPISSPFNEASVHIMSKVRKSDSNRSNSATAIWS